MDPPETSGGVQGSNDGESSVKTSRSKVGEMESVLELLLETLSALSEDSLSEFWVRYLDRERSLSSAGITDLKGEPFPLSAVKTELEILAVSLLQREGKLAVDVTEKILTDINETHLVQRLWDRKSRNKKNPDDHLPALLHKAATMAAVKELLLETLTNLNPEDFEKFKIFLKFSSFQKKLPEIPWSDLERADCRSTVNVMLATYGQWCLEVTSQVLTDLNQTDLLEYLPEKSDGAEEKLSFEELWPGLIDKVEAMESVLELLLETLGALNEGEQRLFIDWIFKKILSFEDRFQYQRHIDRRLLDLQDAVFEMVQQTGLKSVETTKTFLMEIKRPDLLQRIETCSKRQEKKLSVDERRSAVVHKVALMAAFKQLLTDVLRDLKKQEFEDFKTFLNSILSPSVYNPYRSPLSLKLVPDTVDRMVETFGLRSLDVSMEILRDINRSDLVQRLLENSSGLKGKAFVDEYLRADVLNRVPAKVALKRTLLKMLRDLDRWDVRKFKWLLQFTCFQKGLPDIPDISRRSRSWFSRSLMDPAEEGLDPPDLVVQMVQRLGQESVDVAREVLTDMKRTDVVQKLTGSSLGSKEELQSLLLQKVGEMESVLELLLETLSALSEDSLSKFWVRYLDRERSLSSAGITDLKGEPFPLSAVKTELEILAVSLLQREGKLAVDVTEKILTDINETHLVQRLWDRKSRNKKNPDDHLPALLHKAATMAAVKELLLETLTNLNPEDFEKFKIFLKFSSFQKKLPEIPWSDLERADCRSTVNVMLATYGQRCLEVTSQVLTDLNQTDLLEYLPEKSDGAEEKLSLEELWPGLIDKVEAMESVLELLLETLGALNEEEQRSFIDWIFKKILSFEDRFQYQHHIDRRLLDLQDAVFEMVQQTGLKSVETTKTFLMEIKRPDLLQRIETCSKRQEKKLSVDERRSAVVHKVALMAAFKQLLTDVLRDLKQREFKNFKKFLKSILSPSEYNPYRSPLSLKPVPDTVDRMVETFGLRSLDVSMEILRDINRSDLVQRLLENSSGLKGKAFVDEYLRADVLNRVPAKVALKRTLRKMMRDLNRWDVRKFKWLLQFTCFQKGLPDIPDIRLGSRSWFSRSLMDLAEEGLDPPDLVDQMVERLGQESVDVAREVLTDMKRTDVVQKLTGSSLGSKEELQSLLLQKEASLTAVMEKLLETFEDLDEAEFQRFWRVLQKRLSMKHRRRTPTYFKESKWKVAEQMFEEFHERTLDVAIQILKKINRSDLVQKISEKVSTGPVKRLDAKESKGVMPDSSCWTELKPVENRTDAGEAPTYSFRCEAGHFECSVSGLRWVCSEKVIFKYRFCSWDGHMEGLKSRGYMPAGPMMDITLITGKMMEVFLPHWICTDDIPKPLEWFAVLHMDDCGDAVEKVSEVSSAHVKLYEPIFSPRAALMKIGFPVKISCKVLIYQTNTAFLTLHVYLIPRDPALQQKMDQEETSHGYKVIRKPGPEKSLKMKDYFILSSDLDAAEVSPKVGLMQL
ncbi:uncharacterized protein V3H82_012564 isoform 2-T2 [Fundulus diaphanus]